MSYLFWRIHAFCNHIDLERRDLDAYKKWVKVRDRLFP